MIHSVLSQFGNWIVLFSQFTNSMGIPYLVILLALSNAWNFKRNLGGKKLSPVHALVSTFITGFGGSSIAGILIFNKLKF